MLTYEGEMDCEKACKFIDDFGNIDSSNHSKVTVKFKGMCCTVIIESTNEVNDEFLKASFEDGLLNHWGYSEIFMIIKEA